ncbi:hypothetical protein [Methanoregula sp.]|uniref:hypothetical protein n=1 Tax=Methanoregula sp. TaxID=2052170 RepID=UPI0035667DD3
MAKYCPECKKMIPDSLSYCPDCGTHLDVVIKPKIEDDNVILAAEFSYRRDSPVTSLLKKYGLIVAGVVIICAVVMISLFLSGIISPGTSLGTGVQEPGSLETPQGVNTTVTLIPAAPAESAKDRNIRVIKGIVEQYHKDHTYIGNDIFDCEKMAMDVWDMVETQGITARIQVGNVEKNVSKIEDANHAWVLAEVAPGQWVGMETTGGYLVCPVNAVCSVNNPRYFTGWSFSNPKELNAAYEQLNHPCQSGYVLGSDKVCHVACGGSTYCLGDSVCVNGECRGCLSGYVLGDDLKCHATCGNTKSYCKAGTVCVNGECRGCDPGYVLGMDYECHQPCGTTTSYCTDGTVCVNGQCRGCDDGWYLGNDLKCYKY